MLKTKIRTYKVRTLIMWWRWGGSNPLPLECHSSALPSELHPHGTSAYQRRTLLSSALLYYQIISSLSTPNFQFFLWRNKTAGSRRENIKTGHAISGAVCAKNRTRVHDGWHRSWVLYNNVEPKRNMAELAAAKQKKKGRSGIWTENYLPYSGRTLMLL